MCTASAAHTDAASRTSTAPAELTPSQPVEDLRVTKRAG
jgi:hypothetical protein